jgi:hypothetical protein
MVERRDPESERLNEAAAKRLLERATELDARLASESTVADLRDAARSAGISDEAFSRALAEVRHEGPAPLPTASASRNTWRRRRIIAAIVLLIGGLGFALARRVVPSPQDEYARAATPTPAAEPRPVPRAVTKKTAPARSAPTEAPTKTKIKTP